MTNEDLCREIRAGAHELMGELLLQNRGMIHRMANRYYPAAVRNHAAEMEDLEQTAALGLLRAVDAWEESRGAFLTVAAMYMQNELRAVIGVRSAKQRIENVAPPVSLYATLPGETDTLLVDTIADPDAVDPCEAAVQGDHATVRIVQEELQSLLERQRAVMTAHTMNRRPLRLCANALGMTLDECRSAEQKALRTLRRRRRIRELCADYETMCYGHKSRVSYSSSWCSVVEDAALRRQRYIEDLDRAIATAGEGEYAEQLKTLRETLLRH